MTSAKQFYKYKKYDDYLLDSLENKYFYFAKPSQMDDPFECSVIPNFDNTTDEEIEKWIDFMETAGAKMPYKDVAAVRKAINSGELKNHYFEDKSILDKFHIFSLCEENDNQLLWAMYADYYNGVCIGYNTYFIDESESEEIYNDKFALDVKIPNIKQCGILSKNFPYGNVKLNPVIYGNNG